MYFSDGAWMFLKPEPFYGSKNFSGFIFTQLAAGEPSCYVMN